MAAADDVTALYLSILKRQPDSTGLAGFVAAVNAGISLAAVQAAIQSSPEGQIVAIYQRELGRVPEAAAVQANTKFLAQTGTVEGLSRIVALSDEAQRNINSIYNQLLDRNVDAIGLEAYKTALANGASLTDVRMAVAFSQEAQNDLAAIFQNELGRPAPLTPTAPFTQTLIAGSTLADVREIIANSPEAIADVSRAFQAASGVAPNNVAQAAAASELQSGISINALYAEIAELPAGMPATPAPIPSIAITPTLVGIGGSQLAFISSLGNNDAYVSLATYFPTGTSNLPSRTSFVRFINDGTSFSAVIQGFDTRADYIQIPSSQASNFSSLKITDFAPTIFDGVKYVGGTEISIGSSNSIKILAPTHVFLQESNFRFV